MLELSEMSRRGARAAVAGQNQVGTRRTRRRVGETRGGKGVVEIRGRDDAAKREAAQGRPCANGDANVVSRATSQWPAGLTSALDQVPPRPQGLPRRARVHPQRFDR